ncbi:MAG: HAD hydrolase-like protein [Faecalibacterium sp.]|nr:HAD hydrolase-like protein [Ruminococcus sp.]MCM1392401.1 HAD hydrolase-like protein [Ruminococcus sp.]MCM1484878.1 HAD hydrolase-like protein [Faecalibacterium sp.]
MNRYDYVIFDFDGTVTDTGEGILKSLQYSFTANGRPAPDLKDLKKFIGPPIHYSYVNFYDISEEEVGEYIKKYRERYRAKGIYECYIYDGMRELIESLRENGVKIGIASSKPIKLIYDVMNHLGITDLFDAVSGVQFDDSNHIGKTDLVLDSMKQLNVTDKRKVLMVGDRYFDIDGAAGAGVDSCGVLFGYGSKEEFEEHNATYIVAKADEIKNIVFNS